MLVYNSPYELNPAAPENGPAKTEVAWATDIDK